MNQLEKAVKDLDWHRLLFWRDLQELRSDNPQRVRMARARVDRWRNDLDHDFSQVRNLLGKRF